MKTAVQFDVHKLQLDVAERGWVPADLADKSGLSRPTISRVMRGEGTARTWATIAEAMGYSVRRYVIRKAAA